MEWGCIAILSQSDYGIFSTGSTINETNTPTTSYRLGIWNNSSKQNITGSVASAPDEYITRDNDTHLDTTGAYNSANGAKASTTGTIYGIYDTAGGTQEAVMGFMEPSGGVSDTSLPIIGRSETDHSGFMGATRFGAVTTSENGGNSGIFYFNYSWGATGNSTIFRPVLVIQ